PLETIRRFHQRIEKLEERPEANVGEVLSIDDYLPASGEAQEDKVALARAIDAALARIRPPLPPTALVLEAGEVWRGGAAVGGARGRWGARAPGCRPSWRWRGATSARWRWRWPPRGRSSRPASGARTGWRWTRRP